MPKSLFFVGLVVGCLLVGCGPSKPSPQGQWNSCRANLRNMRSSFEMYASDNGGLYPLSLDKLAPTYLAKIPTCPAAGVDSYSSTYKSEAGKRDEKGNFLSGRDYYELYCSGHHHREAKDRGVPVGSDKPAFNSEKGLID